MDMYREGCGECDWSWVLVLVIGIDWDSPGKLVEFGSSWFKQNTLYI